MSSNDNELLFSYYNSNIYQSDYDIALQRTSWLNDSLVGFIFDYIQHKNKANNSSVICVSPYTSFILIHETDIDDLQDAYKSINIDYNDTKLIIFPINNNSNITGQGGTHWSLLCIDLYNKTALHYDSMLHSGNSRIAQKLYNNLINFIQVDMNSKVVGIECKQQNNGYDCGIYTCVYAELLYKFIYNQHNNINTFSYTTNDIIRYTADNTTQQYINDYRGIIVTRLNNIIQSSVTK